ncbi:protein kinase domain-containing protein [Bremerella alba]|uniref:Serine/threonine-protein kinase PknD n=1 Tax=Bremerella alba TaxID=980252 RepID=A0A7V9A6W6_9BACT|nr:protein kinase [Bremerella alba]MBA2114707.1 Serine/threonine-protein kinase PknD [Bremerella alba]
MQETKTQADRNSRELLAELIAGRPEAADRIFTRYAARLLPLIRKQISLKLQGRIDAEDITQSAMGSFFHRASNDQFVLERSGDLWRLLAAISLNKLRRRVAWHSAAKRSIKREEPTLPASNEAIPSHEDAIAALEIAEGIFRELSADEQTVLRLTLSGDTPEEIAREMSKSPRTVRRWLQAVRDAFEHQVDMRHLPKAEARATLSWEDYLLKQHVGSGGFGKVYRAIEKRRNRTVAIKALHKRHQKDPFAVEYFIQESTLLAKIHHPCVVGVHGLGQYPGGGYFLVLDWVEGEDLQKLIDRQPLNVAEALRVIRQVAVGIEAVHEANIVHGDLKPGNVLVSRCGAVHVTDFGFAALRSDPPSKRLPRGGTVAYLAPEQLQDSAIDNTLDIYGLGGLLYALLTGQPPRVGSPSEILNQLENKQPPLRPSVAKPELSISPELEALILRCLDPDPARRFSDVSAFLNAVKRINC